jgi:hypothetical protein
MKVRGILLMIFISVMGTVPASAFDVGFQIGGIKKLSISHDTSTTEIRRSRNAPKTKGCIGPSVSDIRIINDSSLRKSRSPKGLKGLLKKLFFRNPRTNLPY